MSCFHRLYSKRPLAIVVFTALTTTCFFVYLTFSQPMSFFTPKSSLHSLESTPDIVYLQNVQANESEFSSGKNIFFIVSTLSRNGEIKLNARQACAIESAARSNPDWKIFPLFVATTWFNSTHNEFISPLLRYCNIHMRFIDWKTFATGTPVEDLFTNHILQNSSFVVEHTSDVFRLLTLYKYGGTYVDTDVVVRRSFDLLLPNFFGLEGRGYVGSAVFNLQASGYGHRFAGAALKDLAEHFDGKVWTANGPMLLTRNLQKFCNVLDVTKMSRERCGGQLSVLPPDAFFRVRYWQHERFFHPEHTETVMASIKDDIVVHLWNKLSSKIQQKVDSSTAYVKLAHEYCPNVIKACGEFF
uniref:Alpha 1,4-glycosyltransferase domain-containing protein n=1 Tax=Culex quinquefasciatus TaxID=7176 RepID=A0A1S4KI02_CULQU